MVLETRAVVERGFASNLTAAQTQLAKRMLALIEGRPRVDFDDRYFTASYTNEFLKLELEHTLLREMIASLVADARLLHTRCGPPLPTTAAHAAADAGKRGGGKEAASRYAAALAKFGFPDGKLAGDASSYVPLLPNTTVVAVLELLPGLDHISHVPALVSDAAGRILSRFQLAKHTAAHHLVEIGRAHV